MQRPTSLSQLDARLRASILRVSPCERFQQLDDARQFDAGLHAARVKGKWEVAP